MGSERRIPKAVLSAVFDDLSDGAYLAAMEEFGYDVDELVDEPAPRPFKCKRCKKGFRTEAAKRQHAHDTHNRKPIAKEVANAR